MIRSPNLLIAFMAILAGALPPAWAAHPGVPLSQYREAGWTTASGLPQDTIPALLQTSDGYLWIGTAHGLVRYDGVRFVVFDRMSSPALRDDNVTSLLEDRAGTLWIGTRRGLFSYRDGSFHEYGEADGLAEPRIVALASDGDGSLWVGTRNGLFRREGESFVSHGVEEGLPRAYVYTLAADASGTMWAGTVGGGLARFEGDRWKPVTLAQGPFGAVSALGADPDGSLWVGTLGGGLFRLGRDGSTRRFTEKNGLPSGYVMAVQLHRGGGLWIGTWDGLCQLRGGQIEPLSGRYGAASARILTLAEDREGSLWIGSQGSGLRRLSRVSLMSLSAADGLPSERTTGLVEDRDGNIWIGTADAGLYRRGKSGVTVFTTAEGLSDDSVAAVAQGPGGAIWVGTGKGLDRIRGDRISNLPTPPGLEPPIWSLAFAPDGALWIGHFGGTGRLEDGRFEAITTSHTGSALATLAEPSGTVWVGTGGEGLFRYDGEGITWIRSEDGLPGDSVQALHLSDDGALWVGTDEGLAVVREGHVNSFPLVRGLPTGPVVRILEDGSAHLWLSTNSGIFRVAREQIEAVERGEAREVASMMFGIADGMPLAECIPGFRPAGERTSDGRLWFPTLKGLASVDPEHLVLNELPPPVRIEDVLVDGAPVREGPGVALSPEKRNFEFHYTALSFPAPERVRFRYRLVGYDDEWVEAGARRTAYFMNLPAGRYTFEVIAANNDGVWNTTPAAFDFSLSPHLYMTVWFYVLLTAGVSAVLYAAYRRHQRAVQREFSVVLAERGRMAREIHDTLAQGLSGISIQLESVAETLTSSPEEAREHLDRARGLARSSLSEARRSVLDLRAKPLEQRDLMGALSQTVTELAWGTSVRTSVEVQGKRRALPREVEDNLLRIGQEAVRNALRHAGASQIRVELEFDSYEVRLRVLDDGGGFDPATATNGGTGRFGLVGMRERAEQIEGQLEVRSASGAGTQIVVTVPVR